MSSNLDNQEGLDTVDGSGDSGGTWKEKQDFIVRFINEIGDFIDGRVAEFEIPPVVIVGALETLKQEWIVSMMGETLLIASGLRRADEENDDDGDEDDSTFPGETDETEE